MSATLYWLQCGSCGGDTWSLLNASSPDIIEFFESMRIEVLWHPGFSGQDAEAFQDLNHRLASGRQPLDILCIEGSVLCGPNNTGRFDTLFGSPKKDLIAALAGRARHVVAVGTCASYGGIGTDSAIEATGLQFRKWEKGGFLGKEFRTSAGKEVVNLPGCPAHCDVVRGTLAALVDGIPFELGINNTPAEWYNILVHQGCTRNEYHEYRVEEKRFGDKGCMFFYLGCHGPLAYGPCNKVLWNHRSSKTRVGVPCFGCTRPDFPQPYAFFETRNIEGIPIELPDGISRAHYMAYKGMAAAAAPERLKTRKTGI